MSRYFENIICFILLTILLSIFNINGYGQLIPDFSMPFKVVSPMGEDSVVLGLSRKASEGYNEGYDVIDTSDFNLPVDLRIFDPLAVNQLGDNCKHFSTSFQSFPTKNIHEIAEFERTFTLALRIDLDQINNNVSGGSDCDYLYPTEDTFLQFDLTSMYEYQFINTGGYNIELIEIIPSGNVNIVAIDGFSWEGLARPIEICLAMLTYGYRIDVVCDVDIYFNVKFKVRNKTYVNIAATAIETKITSQDNLIHIKNALAYNTLILFDFNGKLLHQQNISINNVIIDISPYGKQMYLLHLSDPSNSHYLTHKILNL